MSDITYPVVVPSSSFMGRLFGRKQTEWHTPQTSQITVHYRSPETEFGTSPTPNAIKCLYCERRNSADKFQCEGCGASLHVILET